MLVRNGGLFAMQDFLMSQIGMEPEQDHYTVETYGGNGWADAYSYNPSQHQQPIYEYGAYSYSMASNPAGYQSDITAQLPAAKVPTKNAKSRGNKVTRTDEIRKKICECHEDNPILKQTEIAGE
jgi:hypothetical protein